MTDEDLKPLMLAHGRRLWPEMMAQEAAAHLALGEIIFSGDPRRIREGAQRMADLVDAQAGCYAYAMCEPDMMRHDG